MRRSSRAAAVLGAAATLLAGACTAPGEKPLSPVSPAPATRAHDPSGVLVHLFQWPWADVAKECPALAADGVTGVQLSPPQEHVVLPGHPWWQDYQPVSYTLSSRRGDRAALAAMVRACHAAGVKVYADAVVNHMTAQQSGTGSAGTAFTHYAYPDQPAGAFHPPCAAQDYGDRAQVQNCELLGLADLATETEPVRARLAAYLNDLLSVGVDGFRIDAAKHLPAADLRAILDRLDRPATVWSEVLYSPTEPIQPTEYRDLGATLEPRYADTLGRAFRTGSLESLAELGAQTGSPFTDLLPPEGSVVYVDSHDSQRGGSTLSHADGPVHTLAVQFMLAWPYGTPLLMSSFAFDDFDDGPPADASGRTLPVECDGKAFVCEHRLPAVRALVRWRAAVGTAPVTGWWATPDAIGFARGAGYFALNRATSPVTRELTGALAPGRYRDLVSGQTMDVAEGGALTLTVPAGAAVALLPS
ncbi:alpha-amylase family protein [Catellatospora bangladeshensis]|uniref:Alpha-amylase n=1 Tax=Catellatospora bangladeshensis TaxID=310355 RepID=A0A8J3NG68_9ACTN|nr:alpha-amylase family protein [Catellatospora bangladeshensis]GIF80080.1 alpha-amylase [Catellatospora bangladeshensis]